MPPSKKWHKKRAENFHGNNKEPGEPVVKDNSVSSGRESDQKKVKKSNSPASSSQQAPKSSSSVPATPKISKYSLKVPPESPSHSPNVFYSMFQLLITPFRRRRAPKAPKPPHKPHHAARNHVTIIDVSDEDDASLLTQRIPLSDRLDYILDLAESDDDGDAESALTAETASELNEAAVSHALDCDNPNQTRLLECDDVFGSSTSPPPPSSSSSSTYTPHNRTAGLAAPGRLREKPPVALVELAALDLERLLRGKSRGVGGGYKSPDFNMFVRVRLEGMRSFLNFYIDPRSKTYGHWDASSLMAAISLSQGTYCAKVLRALTRQYIADCTVLPLNPYGNWNQTLLINEDLCNHINLFLQEIGTTITAEKLVEFLARPDVMEKHGIERRISVRTARRYLRALGYRFMSPKKGQYADGHERTDVVLYRDNTFIPTLQELIRFTRKWDKDNLIEEGPLPGRRVIIWYHDETIFYAHDRRRKTWYHKDSSAIPYKKTEGHSFMVADYFSADFGWLRGSDGSSAQCTLFPGADQDGYFSAKNIWEQADAAMDIVQEQWPDFDHVFIYDNATTHLKRAEDALSARRMPKGVSDAFGVELVHRHPVTGKVLVDDAGKPLKYKIQMSPASFADGTPQPLYYPEGHNLAGKFKGIVNILTERGISTTGKKLECDKFKCPPPAINCCCRRILYNQPDFVNVESILESRCKARGICVLFLPKFHCKLNPIEQCWGYAKRLYRFYPESSHKEVLKKYSLECLDGVPLDTMRRFCNRSLKFVDAYFKGLNGREAAWAARKYRGHRVLPESLMNDMERAGMR